jgi:hypothetical protein
MDKNHFVRNIPLHTYAALARWFYFSICLLILFFLGLSIIDIPLVWQWYQKKSLYSKQKNIYTKEQQIVVKQQTIQNDIKKLEQQIDILYAKNQPTIAFLKMVLENQYQLTVTSIKQSDKSIFLEGVAPEMNSITNGLKKLGEETNCSIALQSIERKNSSYVFHAICRPKK